MDDISILKNSGWHIRRYDIMSNWNKVGSITFVNDRIVLERYKDNYKVPITYVSYYEDKTESTYTCFDLFVLNYLCYNITQEEIDIYLAFE